jgi:pimeloyl-ACP methyl ester carboxylesterase
LSAATSAKAARPVVVLVHGLWMNAAALLVLQARMRRCGFGVVRFGYPSVRAGLAENAAQLSRLLKTVQADEIHIVAHSMGGLVTLRALELTPDARVRRIVLMGSPVGGSLSGRRLASFHAGRWMLGVNSRVWEAPHSVHAPAGVEIGVIAGTMAVGLGRLVGKLPRPHDGAVSASETELENATDTIQLHVSHSAMLFSGSVGRQACHFLQHARFDHDAAH